MLGNILDKLIHNDEYETIDEHLTDGNVGSRKRRNVRDNLFVVNAFLLLQQTAVQSSILFLYRTVDKILQTCLVVI